MIYSLRARVTVFLLLVALIPIGLLYYYHFHSNEEIRESMADELLDVVFFVNSEINSFLSDRVKVLEVTANTLTNQEVSFNVQHSPVSAFVDNAEQLLDVFDSFSLLLQLDRHGRLLTAAARTDDGERADVSALYKKYGSTEGGFIDVISENITRLNDISTPVILKVVKTDLLPDIGIQAEYVLPLIVPVRNRSNDRLGHIVAFVSMDRIKRFLKKGADGIDKMYLEKGHSSLHLINSDGLILIQYSHNNHEYDNENGSEVLSDAVMAEVRNSLNISGDQANRGVSQSLISSLSHEEEQLMAFDKQPSEDDIYGLGWILLTHVPVSMADESLEHANRDYLIATLGSIFLVILFGLWAGTGLTRPVASITRAMSRLKDGLPVEYTPPTGRRDEAGQLADVFISFQSFLNERNELLHKQEHQLRELAQARKQVEALMDSSAEAMLVVDSEGIIDRTSSAADEIFGYDPGELVGQPMAVLVPARFKGHGEMLQSFMKNTGYRSMGENANIVGLKKDGSEISLDISLSPLESTEGIKALAIVRDLTQERCYQEELRKLATVAEQTNNLVVMTDKNRRIEWVNEAYVKVTGYTLEEVIGTKAGHMLRGKDTDQETVATINQALHAGKAVRSEILNYTKDGQPLWLDIDIHPVYGDKGIEHYVAIETDVTDRHLMEEQLLQSIIEREQQVVERTRDLTLALEKADAAVRAKSAFLAMMSHEIRTPLNGIVGMAELLRNGSLQPKQIGMLDVIKDSSFSLQRIIDDILDYSKIEAGQLSFEAVPVNLKKLVEAASEVLAPAASIRSVNLVTHMDAQLPETVLADPLRLRQIFYNLVGNAIKFTEPSGIIRVDVIVSDTSDESVKLEIVVKDTGIGMSADYIEHLFTPFTQADDSTTRRYGGTGLGMTICRRLIDMMGGQIDVESTPGEGSTFRIRLELPVVQAAFGDAPDLTGLRVLGVSVSDDQNSGFPSLLKSDISTAGATVDCQFGQSGDIVQAINDSAKTGKPYDLVLICQQDSSQAYYETYKKLQAIPEAERPGIVLLLPQHDPNDYQDVALVNANPLSINQLLECMAVSAGRMVSNKCCRANVESDPQDKPCEDEMVEAKDKLILVAEDNAVNQEVINMQLSALGYNVMIAENGREALELWKQHSFDLILSDCHMPEMDGFELTRAIREAEIVTGKHIPIIAVTANAMSEERDNCIDSGMDDCLTKPVEIDSLEQLIRQWLPDLVSPLADVTSCHTTDTVNDEPNASVNPEVLANLTGGDDEFCKQFLVKFKEASIPIVKTLITASEELNFDEIVALTHQLKSSAKTVGAEYLAELCLNMEQAGKEERADNLPVMISQLTDEFDRVGRYINQYVSMPD